MLDTRGLHKQMLTGRKIMVSTLVPQKSECSEDEYYLSGLQSRSRRLREPASPAGLGLSKGHIGLYSQSLKADELRNKAHGKLKSPLIQARQDPDPVK